MNKIEIEEMTIDDDTPPGFFFWTSFIYIDIVMLLLPKANKKNNIFIYFEDIKKINNDLHLFVERYKKKNLS